MDEATTTRCRYCSKGFVTWEWPIAMICADCAAERNVDSPMSEHPSPFDRDGTITNLTMREVISQVGAAEHAKGVADERARILNVMRYERMVWIAGRADP